MGVQDLLGFIEYQCKDACKPVDLLKVSRKRHGRGQGPLRLIVDAEGCLHRLYGGYYPDWVCGGEWNRMREFLTSLVYACHSANLELTVFFNGALEGHRLSEWGQQQELCRHNINNVLRHIQHKATPPPKVWWLAPAGLRTCLRLTLRQMGVSVACSMDDHPQEVIAYCRENNLFGVIAQNSDYAVFDPPRYFSSDNLKLTYKSGLETTEYVMDEVAKLLNLHPKRFCLLSALLGTHILPEEELHPFLSCLCGLPLKNQSSEELMKLRIQRVIDFVRELPSEDDLDGIAEKIFGTFGSSVDDTKTRFKQSVQYYLNGTSDGFLKYKPKISDRVQHGSYPTAQDDASKANKKSDDNDDAESSSVYPISSNDAAVADVSKIDCADKQATFDVDNVYTDGASGYHNNSYRQSTDMITRQIAEISLRAKPKTRLSDELDEEFGDSSPRDDVAEDGNMMTGSKENIAASTVASKPTPISSSYTADMPVPWTLHKTVETSSNESAPHTQPVMKIEVAAPSHDVMRIASERHQKGLMSPWIYQLLSQRVIKLDITLEDWACELPQTVLLFRPIRQKVYAILFDVARHHIGQQNMEKNVDIGEVCEWTWNCERGCCTSHMVHAVPLDWPTPSLHKMWLGEGRGDRQVRLRAFLSCMSADGAPLLMDTSYVPQHLLVLCCLLRYLLKYPKQRVLRRLELDAFLAAAVSPLLHNTQSMSDMKLPMLSVRGVLLGSLLMHATHHAVLVNDACGSPIPAELCSPWNFYDGKLFHLKLLKANNSSSLQELCGGHMDDVMRLERLRLAILQGLQHDMVFAKPILPLMDNPYCDQSNAGSSSGYMQAPLNMRPAGMPNRPQPMFGRGMAMHHHGGSGGMPQVPGMQCPPSMHNSRMQHAPAAGMHGPGGPVDTRGGQLQIAGIVVGNWGGNTTGMDGPHPRGRGTHVAPPPRVTSVGPYSGMNQGRPGNRMPYWKQNDMAFHHPGTRQIAAEDFYGVRRQRPRRKPASVSKQIDLQKVTLEQRTKSAGCGRGRGCTVESRSEESGVLSVSDLIKQTTLQSNSTMSPHRDDTATTQGDIFEDASTDIAVSSAGDLPNGVHTV